MPTFKVRSIEDIQGELHHVIPPLVNKYGQWEAGRRLGISGTTINRWLKDNGYRRRVTYIQEEKGEAS
jgi:transposase-like protein